MVEGGSPGRDTDPNAPKNRSRELFNPCDAGPGVATKDWMASSETTSPQRSCRGTLISYTHAGEWQADPVPSNVCPRAGDSSGGEQFHMTSSKEKYLP